MSSFHYDDSFVPQQYCCGKCGVHGVKLWREYQTFLSHQSLLCGDCACKEQSNAEKTFTISQGISGGVDVHKNPDPHGSGGGDQIGWRIPAVPTEEGDTYWGYTSVPANGCAWWNRLPLRTVSVDA